MRRWLVLPLLVVGCSTGDVPVSVPAATDAAVGSAGGESTGGTTSPTGTTDPDAVLPEGYALVRATVTEADGTECEVCLWLAADSDQRRSGLMFVTDLGEGDGMAFRYPGPHTGTFWMENTVLPLSIAFFAPDGRYLDEFDMEPCPDGDCPKYRTPRDFLVAIETPQGDLGELGIGPGSTLELTDLPCE